MKTIEDQLTTYAGYHRDRRNIATHFFGVPMIVFGVAGLLSRPAFSVAGIVLGPIVIVAALVILFYFLLDLRIGAVMAAFMGAATYTGLIMGAQSTATWLGISLFLFVVGWVIQFIGHAWEGRKPAFMDDIVGLLIGPLFVTCEWIFMLGLRKELRDAVVRRAGPSRVGKPTQTAAS